MPAWLVLRVRYLWPLFGYTIPSFVVLSTPEPGARTKVCVDVWNVRKNALEQLCLCDTSWQSTTVQHIQRTQNISALCSMTGSWSCVQFLQQRNPQHVKTSRCFGALKFEHHYETVTCSRSSWVLLFITACCHECMNHIMQLFALLLRCLTSCCCSSHLSQGGSRNSKEVHRGAAILFQEHWFWKVTHKHTNTHSYHVLYNGEDLPWLLLFLKSEFCSLKATKDYFNPLCLHFIREKDYFVPLWWLFSFLVPAVS